MLAEHHRCETEREMGGWHGCCELADHSLPVGEEAAFVIIASHDGFQRIPVCVVATDLSSDGQLKKCRLWFSERYP